jgi:hypothetical protein
MIFRHNRPVSAGFLAGATVGLIAGAGARVAMRLVAIAGNVAPAFTVAGTLTILITGVLYGVAAGLLFVAVRPRLPGSQQGVIFGLVLVLGFGPIFFLADQVNELHVAPLAGIILFSMLFFLTGLLITATTTRLEQFLPAPSRRTRAYRTLTIVAVIFWLGFLPALIWQVVLAVRHIAAFLASS